MCFAIIKTRQVTIYLWYIWFIYVIMGFNSLWISALGITRCVLNAIKLLTIGKKTVWRAVMMTMQYIQRCDICVVTAAGRMHSIKKG